MVKKYLKVLLKLGLSALAVYIIVQKVDLSAAWQYIKEAKLGFLLLAILCFLFSKSLSALRINRLYSTQGLYLTDVFSLKVYLLGMFYNLFIPLVGGEGYKVIYLKNKFKASAKRLGLAALLDRVSGMVALCLLSIIFLVWSSYTFPYKWAILALIPILYAAHYIGVKWLFKSFTPVFLSTSVLSFGVQAFQVVCAYCVLLALGVDSQVIEYLLTFLLATFAFVLPLLGAREMAFVFGADYLQLNTELSLAISLLFSVAMLFSSFLGVYFLLFPKHLKEEKAIAITEART